MSIFIKSSYIFLYAYWYERNTTSVGVTVCADQFFYLDDYSFCQLHVSQLFSPLAHHGMGEVFTRQSAVVCLHISQSDDPQQLSHCANHNVLYIPS